MTKFIALVFALLASAAQAATVVMVGFGAGGAASNTSLLICNDSAADASTTFDDESANNFTVTAGGNAQYDTAQFVSNSTSSCLFDGTGDYLSVADDTALDLANIWTIEFWVRRSTSGTFQHIVGKRSGGGTFGSFLVYFDAANSLQFRLSSNGSSNDITGGTAIVASAVDTWYHIAISADGTTIRHYVNGAAGSGSQITTSASLVNNAQPVRVGIESNGTENPLTGWVQGLRITKGEALYTAPFTAPTPPLTP